MHSSKSRYKNQFSIPLFNVGVYGVSLKKLAEVPRYSQNLTKMGGVYNHINYEKYVTKPVSKNPEMLRKSFWEGTN